VRPVEAQMAMEIPKPAASRFHAALIKRASRPAVNCAPRNALTEFAMKKFLAVFTSFRGEDGEVEQALRVAIG